MATGELGIRITDLAGQMLPGVRIDLEPVTGEPGSGGEPRTVSVAGTVEDLTITGIPCREGLAPRTRSARRRLITGSPGSTELA